MARIRENGGYTNGYYNSSNQDGGPAPSFSRGPGGYGGLGSDTSPTRSTRLERRHANRRSVDQRWNNSRSRSRPRPGSRPGPGETTSDNTRVVEDILRYIEQQWSFMSSESCVPVRVALQLMDQSSLGLADQADSFQRTHQQLQTALKAIVNEHHQGFNSSIGTFHQIQASLQLSQQRVRDLKASLVQAKGNLGISRPELKNFATASQDYDQMLQILGHIEELRGMPEKLEMQITDKRFLGAVDTLQEALKLIKRPEMEEVGALADLQVYLSNQEHSIVDILIEELHSHLYLKSPYCEQRWKIYASRSDPAANAVIVTERRQLFQFLSSLSLSQPLKEDPARNPESDSFSYILLLLEALTRMNRLDAAVDAIEERMPVELFRVVERSYVEVAQRYPNNMRMAGSQHSTSAAVSPPDETRKDIIQEMLSLLYARFEAIAEAHRVAHDVISGILRRQNDKDTSLLRSFNGLWKLYQSEIRSLLHDHLSSTGDLSNREGQHEDVQVNIFRSHVRDKTKRLFKLSDTDKAATAIASEREDLDRILKSSVPGLVTQGLASGDRTNESVNAVDRSGTGHKLLVEPSVFNMGSLLPPSLAFLTRLREIVPTNSDVVVSTLTSFLDDFLVNVFEPQMEESLAEACAAVYNQPDAFQEDPRWRMHATKPIFKCTIELMDLISAFCRMLVSLPPNQSFSELILSQVRTHYNRLNDLYRTIGNKPSADQSAPKSKYRSVALSEADDMQDLLKTLVSARAPSNPNLWTQEANMLIDLIKATPVAEHDLFPSMRSIRQLAVLFSSTAWFIARLQGLKRVASESPGDATTSVAAHQAQAWRDSATHTEPYLPLSTETAHECDSLTASLNNMADMVLRTLHLELRLKALSGIDQALSITYQLKQPFNEPDTSVLALNSAILAYDAELAARLPQANRRACVAKLADAVDAALVALASRVPAMDEFGARRLALNILVLQQGLKEIDSGADLARAASYWECWDGKGDHAVNEFKAGRLGKAEAKEMIRLCFSAVGDPKNRDQALASLT